MAAMLALVVVLVAGQARVQAIPTCLEKPDRTYATLKQWRELGGYQTAESADPKIAKVRVTKGHAEVMGVAPGWVELTLTDNGNLVKKQVCVSTESNDSEHCRLCDLPMSVRFSKPTELVGPYPDLGTWRQVRALAGSTTLVLPPTPPEFVTKVLAAANAALEAAGLKSRLSVTAGLPVLDPMPTTPRDEELASAALGAHLPVLLELLAP